MYVANLTQLYDLGADHKDAMLGAMLHQADDTFRKCCENRLNSEP